MTMTKDDCFYLGRIVKTHGIKGEVTICIDADDPSAYSELKYFLMEVNHQFVPFFIDAIAFNGNKAFVSVQDVKTVQQASEYVGRDVYLPMDVLPRLTGKQFYFHEIKGFVLIDEEKGELGVVADVIEYPMQSVIQVFKDDKEILIPIHDDFIKKVDRKTRKLLVKAPEGLIDMYLGM